MKTAAHRSSYGFVIAQQLQSAPLAVVAAISQPSGSPSCLEISPSGVLLSSVGIFLGKVLAEVVQQVAEVRLADRCFCREF